MLERYISACITLLIHPGTTYDNRAYQHATPGIKFLLVLGVVLSHDYCMETGKVQPQYSGVPHMVLLPIRGKHYAYDVISYYARY